MSPDYPGKFLVGHSLKRPISRFRLKALWQRRRNHSQVFMRASLSNFRDYGFSRECRSHPLKRLGSSRLACFGHPRIRMAIWVAAEMRAGAAYAHSVLALDEMEKAASSSVTDRAVAID